MGLIDRFTRDRVSKFVWSLAFIAMAGLFAASLVMGSRAREAELGRAGDRAARQIGQLIAPELGAFPMETAELQGEALGTAEAQSARILADPRVSAVRIWALDTEHTLIFSTDPVDNVGSAEVENDADLSRAAGGGGAPLHIAAGEGGDAALHTFALIPEAVAEIEQAQAIVLADVNATWGSAATGTAIGAGVMLLLTLLSFRPSVARIGAGVPFVPENVPRGMELIDADRLAAVNDVYALAQQRVDKLKERLQLAENERLFLQGELQRALSGFAPSTEASPPRHAAPEPVAEIPRRPEPEPQRERAPEPSRPAKKQPRRKKEEAPAASTPEQPAEEIAEPTPDAAEILAAAAEVGEVVEASSKAKPAEPEPEPEPVQAPEPEVVRIPEPEIVSLPESEVVVAAHPNGREAAAVGAWSYPQVPEVEALKEDAAEDARDARELLDRLMATESHEIGGPEADPGRIREQIARVAAKKKPGGGEAKKLFTEPEGPKPPWMRERDG